MIDFSDVSIHFGTQDVLRHVSFRVNRGERCGFVGPNGAGKSTVFALITGEQQPDAGTVTIEGTPRIGHLHQQLHEHSEDDTLLSYTLRAEPRLEELEKRIAKLEAELQSGRELTEVESRRFLRELGDAQTEFERLGGYDLESRVKAALSGLGFHVGDFGKPFVSFSGGWKMRAELVRSIVMKPELLLLDEPSNYLDIPAVEWMQKFLREYDGTLLLISHDRFLLRTLTNTTVEIDGCTGTRYSGGLDFYLQERTRRYETLIAAKKNQDRLREETQRFIDTFRYTPRKAAQVQSAIRRLEKLEPIIVPRQASTAGHLRLPPAERAGTTVLRLENVGFSYDQERWIFRGLSFEIGRGDRVAIVGYNGMGKTTLSRLLAGLRPPTEGMVDFGAKVVPGYVSQDFGEIIPMERSLIQAIRLADATLTEAEARGLLGSFGFSGDDAFKEFGVLSGGEKIRLAFARLFACHPNLLILDEPTTHLDLNGRTALEKELVKYEGTLVVISHDIEFIRTVATRIVALEEEGFRFFNGSYDDYRARAQTATGSGALGEAVESDSESAAEAVGSEPQKRLSAKELRKERAAERARSAPRKNDLRRRVEQSESRIIALEEEQASLVASLEAAEPGTDFAAVNRRLAEIQKDLAVVNALWEQAASELAFLESE